MTFYEILGVSKNASQEEIRNAYKTLVKKYHPDLYQGDKAFAEKKTQEINEAYDILSDSEKRASYNVEIDSPSYSESYSYTPPKYSSNYNPYTSYQNRYSYTAKSNEYEKRYSDYHRSKTPNSDYSNQGDVVFDSFARKLGANFLVIVVVFIFYLIIFIATILQYNSYKKDQKTKELNRSFNNTINETNTNLDNNNNNEFNINDYISDSELRQVYYKYYTDSYDSFEEFKEEFSDYIEYYLNSY